MFGLDSSRRAKLTVWSRKIPWIGFTRRVEVDKLVQVNDEGTEVNMTRGTIQREKIYVYDTCQECGEENALVYEAGDKLMCANDYRKYAVANPPKPICDRCGKEGNVLRDPSHRRDEYFCMPCHMETGFAPSNSVVYRTLMEMLKGEQA